MNKKILIKNLPEEERPREKLLKKGADSLSNEELLAIVLGSGTRDTSAKGLAERIICQSSMGLRFLTECVPEELTEIKGIGNGRSLSGEEDYGGGRFRGGGRPVRGGRSPGDPVRAFFARRAAGVRRTDAPNPTRGPHLRRRGYQRILRSRSG